MLTGLFLEFVLHSIRNLCPFRTSPVSKVGVSWSVPRRSAALYRVIFLPTAPCHARTFPETRGTLTRETGPRIKEIAVNKTAINAMLSRKYSDTTSLPHSVTRILHQAQRCARGRSRVAVDRVG